MDISLNGDYDKFIKEQIASGVYKSVNDLVNDALHVFIEIKTNSQEQIDMLNAEIQRGINDYEAGRYQDAKSAYQKLMAKYE
ncbi:type II toxin-antitoxin system ParD family antitoxin [bacterium]|nr:type II toxin-antitoxin system ParD family antitoxin [bacterium]